MDSEMRSLLLQIAKAIVLTLGDTPASEGVPTARRGRKPKEETETAAVLPVAAPGTVTAAVLPVGAAGAVTAAVLPVAASTPVLPIVDEEASKKLALDTAAAFVRHHQKSTPDGIARARAVQAEKFGGKRISDLNHAERLSFVDILKKDMEPVGAAA